MKKVLVFIFYLITQHVLFGQTITIKDRVTGQPLEMVVIYNRTFDITTTTNEAGKADISRFSGTDTLFFRHIGYKTKKVAYNALKVKNFNVFLNIDPITLESFVISASRWQQSKRDVPQKIVTIKPVDVQLENPQTAADLLTISGDVFMQKSQSGGGSPMIRGFATNRVLITVDNVRMNTAIFRSGNVQNVISIDPFSVSNTEVIFGPASVIYGSDAIGGVMNFYTLTPQLAASDTPLIKVNLNGRYASANNERTGHIDFMVGFEKWATLSSFSYNSFGDLRMGSNGPDDYLRPLYAAHLNGKDTLLPNADPLVQKPTGYDQYSFMQKVLFKPHKNLDITYALHYSETSGYSRYDRLLRPKGNGLRSAEWNYGPQKWLMNNLSLKLTSAVRIFDSAILSLARQDFEESRIDRDFGKKTRYTRIEKVKAYSMNLDFEKKLSTKTDLFYGGEYVFNGVNSTGSDLNIETNEAKPGAPRYPDGSAWTSAAVYTSINVKTSERFSFQSGLRFNTFSIDATFDTTFFPLPFAEAHLNNNALTGSAGCVYNPHDTWRFALSISSGFRSPNIDDIGKIFDSSPGAVVVPNPSLKAEKAYNIDLDIAKRVSEYVKIDILGFYTLLNNALVRRDFTLGGADSIIYEGEMSKVQAIQNASRAYVRGIQAGIDITTPFGLTWSTKYNLIKGEEELDNGTMAPLRHAPPHYGISKLIYTYDNLKINFYIVHNGAVPFAKLAPDQQAIDYVYAKDADGNPYTPSYTTFNVKVLYQINDILSLSSGIENITDVRYKPYASGIAAPGRNFIAALKASF